MAFLEVNPRYRSLLDGQGLASVGQLLALPAVIVSGHPERNVARVTVGTGPSAVRAFLKREHRVRWRDRLASAWAGFGPASKSYREAVTLQALRRAGVSCPDWIAAGEDDEGRAFLLVREVEAAVDLRLFLREHVGSSTGRRRFARALGRALARMHEAGFAHRDLYAKHVLVDPRDQTIHFVDWQRSPRAGRVGWRHRGRDLAALDATLNDDLASPRDRLACLRAYFLFIEAQHDSVTSRDRKGAARLATPLRSRLVVGGDAPRRAAAARLLPLRSFTHRIRRRVDRLLRKRHVREVRALHDAIGTQSVIWLDGEALCVTPAFWRELGGRIPGWLRPGLDRGLTRRVVPLPGGRQGVLVRHRQGQSLRWLWRMLRCRPPVSPELREAGMLFRLERQGLPAPRVLAFGQRCPRPWRTESFLLTELGADETGERP